MDEMHCVENEHVSYGSNAAFEPGTYVGFTGYIHCGGIEAYVEDACFRLVPPAQQPLCLNVSMLWECGTWINGDCTGCIWYNGTWLDGRFEAGMWYGGTWHNGIFNVSSWKGGTWRNGVFSCSFFNDGIWWDGTFRNSHWENGMWRGGVWENGSVLAESGSVTHLDSDSWGSMCLKRGWSS